MKDNKVMLSLEIDKDIKDKLSKIADDNEMSLSGLVRLIIKNYIKDEDK